MTLPILIETENGSVHATLAGYSDLQATGVSVPAALEAMRVEVDKRMARGELALLDISPRSVLSHAGSFADDESFGELVREVYAARDSERKE